MEISAQDITIAVTVYNRREYVIEAIRSALNQTIPVKVIVVEDCGSEKGMRDFIVGEFGNRIQYFRNPKNRGLFDNWNACMEYCQTSWFSILHDDDLLLPKFVETMVGLVRSAPDRGLYFGRMNQLLPDGSINPPKALEGKNWRDLGSGDGLEELLEESTVGFAGHLISLDKAQKVGGFRKNSYFTGDWDMWLRLALRFGAVETGEVVAVGRCHWGWERGSAVISRKGWKWLLDNVQRKRNLAFLKNERGVDRPFERARPLTKSSIPLRLLIAFARGFSRRVLFYNWWLFIHSKPPHWRYAGLQWVIRLLGPKSLLIFQTFLSPKDESLK